MPDQRCFRKALRSWGRNRRQDLCECGVNTEADDRGVLDMARSVLIGRY
jgi:hypothetical protein